jgi:hypothetical protein
VSRRLPSYSEGVEDRGRACRNLLPRSGRNTPDFYLGDRFTVVKDLKKELGPGLLADMCKQLRIRKEEL